MNDSQTPIGVQLTIERKGDLQRGWLFTNAGLILLMWGVSWLFWGIYSYIDPPAEFSWDKMMLPASLFGLSGVLFGVLALIAGRRIQKPPSGSAEVQLEEAQSEQGTILLRGWTLAIIGGSLTFWGNLFAVLTIYNLVILRGTPDATTGVAEQVGCFLPGLVIGLPLLLIGSRMIVMVPKVELPPHKEP